MSGLTPRGAHSSCAGHGDLSDQEIPRLVDSLVNRCVQHVSCGWYHTTVVVGMDPNISLLRYQQLFFHSLSRNFTLAHILLTTRGMKWASCCTSNPIFSTSTFTAGKSRPSHRFVRTRYNHLTGLPFAAGCGTSA